MEVIWTYEGADGWFPLKRAQFPNFADHFNKVAPADVQWLFAAFPRRLDGYRARADPDLDRMAGADRAGLGPADPAARQPSASARLRVLRRNGRDRPLVRTTIREPAADPHPCANRVRCRFPVAAGPAGPSQSAWQGTGSVRNRSGPRADEQEGLGGFPSRPSCEPKHGPLRHPGEYAASTRRRRKQESGS